MIYLVVKIKSKSHILTDVPGSAFHARQFDDGKPMSRPTNSSLNANLISLVLSLGTDSRADRSFADHFIETIGEGHHGEVARFEGEDLLYLPSRNHSVLQGR
jgi:hypothetical protein